MYESSIELEEALSAVGPGWSELIHRFYNRIDELNIDVKVSDVKEKFGGLRIYYYIKNLENTKNDVLYEDFDWFIESLEKESFETCEECGSKVAGMKDVNGWYKTWCNNCYTEYKKGEQ